MLKESKTSMFAVVISTVSFFICCFIIIRSEHKFHEYDKKIAAFEACSRRDYHSDEEYLLNKEVVNQLKLNGLQYKRWRRDEKSSTNYGNAKSVDPVSIIDMKIKAMTMLYCATRAQTCPRGIPGIPGRPGVAGVKGEKGAKGETGKRGKQGFVGMPGRRGFKGQKGDTGPKGESENTGLSASAPALVARPLTMTVNETKSAFFSCTAKGNPLPKLEWTGPAGGNVVNKNVKHASISNLIIKNVTINDAGVYQCAGRNPLGSSKTTVRLIVNAKPQIYLAPGPIYREEGTDVIMPKCLVTGFPKPLILWTKIFGVLSQQEHSAQDGVLTLIKVQKASSGIYACQASNNLGKDSAVIQLHILTPPRFVHPPKPSVCAVVGETVILNCSVSSERKVTMQWERNGVNLFPNRKNSHRHPEEIIIKNASEKDSGNYTCFASDSQYLAPKSVSIDLKVPINGKSCEDYLRTGCNTSGVYTINPDGKGEFQVYCEMKRGEAWTVFQRRQDGSVDFYQEWQRYESGFGNLSAEFWLGNKNLQRITAAFNTSLYVELEDWDQNKAHAEYSHFRVAEGNYQLNVGSYSGTAGNSLLRPESILWNHNGMSFTTKDRDNDKHQGINCAEYERGAWWYNACGVSNLNGQYLGKGRDEWHGVWWYSFKEIRSLKFTQMKLKKVK